MIPEDWLLREDDEDDGERKWFVIRRDCHLSDSDSNEEEIGE